MTGVQTVEDARSALTETLRTKMTGLLARP
jgi:hypothetical protein